MLPLYEAKMVHLYDARWASYDPDGDVRDVTDAEKADPSFSPQPRYWVHERQVDAKLAGRWDKPLLLGWRDIARSTDERTLIAASCPRVAVGHTLPLALARDSRLLQALLSSFIVDFTVRQKLGGTHVTYNYFVQFPVPRPEQVGVPGLILDRSTAAWIANRVDRLNGWPRSADTRAALRAELDALAFHVYGVARDDVDYIMETFPIVRRKDESAYGEYRTRRLILQAYDAMATSIRTASPYRSPLPAGPSGPIHQRGQPRPELDGPLLGRGD